MTKTNELPEQTHGQIRNLDDFRRRPTVRMQDLLRHELELAYSDLGGAVFALSHFGALRDARLASRIRQIEGLYSKLAEFDDAAGAAI